MLTDDAALVAGTAAQLLAERWFDLEMFWQSQGFDERHGKQKLHRENQFLIQATTPTWSKMHMQGNLISCPHLPNKINLRRFTQAIGLAGPELLTSAAFGSGWCDADGGPFLGWHGQRGLDLLNVPERIFLGWGVRE